MPNQAARRCTLFALCHVPAERLLRRGPPTHRRRGGAAASGIDRHGGAQHPRELPTFFVGVPPRPLLWKSCNRCSCSGLREAAPVGPALWSKPAHLGPQNLFRPPVAGRARHPGSTAFALRACCHVVLVRTGGAAAIRISGSVPAVRPAASIFTGDNCLLISSGTPGCRKGFGPDPKVAAVLCPRTPDRPPHPPCAGCTGLPPPEHTRMKLDNAVEILLRKPGIFRRRRRFNLRCFLDESPRPPSLEPGGWLRTGRHRRSWTTRESPVVRPQEADHHHRRRQEHRAC